MKTLSSTDANARLNAVLADVAATGEPVTITSHGKPVAVLSPIDARPRRFGHLAGRLHVSEDFDTPMDPSELALWEGPG